jgi:hypothetical protein
MITELSKHSSSWSKAANRWSHRSSARTGTRLRLIANATLADSLLDLQKEKQDYEARQIIDANKRSGKTLHEMMIFLGA